MSRRSRKPAEQAFSAEEHASPEPKTHKKRWRLALTVISFTRALNALAKIVIYDKGQVTRSIFYISINVPTNEDDSAGESSRSLLDLDQKALTDMVKDKNLDLLRQFGGVKDLASTLGTDVKGGIGGGEADLMHRKDVFGANVFQKPPAKRFMSFFIEAFKDTTIIILLVCAILSLGFGIKKHGLKNGWYDGGSIVLAVLLVVIVTAVSNFKQSRQFDKLSSKSSDISVEIVRSGQRRPISIFDIVVGDLVCLKIGDQVPADGVFMEGHSLKVDESSMTGCRHCRTSICGHEHSQGRDDELNKPGFR